MTMQQGCIGREQMWNRALSLKLHSFLNFINDISDDIISVLGIYADDKNIYTCLDNKSDDFEMVKLAGNLKNKLQFIFNWVKE